MKAPRVPELSVELPDDVPKEWTPAWVMRRIVSAYEILARLPGTVGPKAFGNNWPSMVVEYQDLIDAQAREQEEAAKVATLDRRRNAPTSAQITEALDALSWCARFLQAAPAQADALQLWALCVANGRDVERILRARRRKADAMRAHRLKELGGAAKYRADAKQAAARRVAVRVVAMLNSLPKRLDEWEEEAKDAARRQATKKVNGRAALDKKGQPVVNAAKLSKLLVGLPAKRIAREAQMRREITRSARIMLVQDLKRNPASVERPALIKRSDVMPGRCFTSAWLAKQRNVAAELIAAGLSASGVRPDQPTGGRPKAMAAQARPM